jgi:histidyl-tRNA synthetase
MQFKKPTGTTDFYPEDMEIRNNIFASLKETAAKFGFKEVETPAFEAMELLAAKSGEEVSKQIFVLEQKGDEKFGLRFDLTVPMTRMFIEKQKELPKPVKWFGLSRMWRYERPQAGRLREFYQLSVEMFGSDKPEADAEIINLAVSCLRNLGLNSEDFYVRINNRKLLQGIIEQFAEDKELTDKIIALVDKKNKISPEEFDKGLADFKVKEPENFKELLAIKELEQLNDLELNEMARTGLNELKQIFKFLGKRFVELDLTVARGLAYYTGTVFELYDKSGKFRAIAGGGRYDKMVEQFGGEPCPATGFGLGYSTLSLLLQDKGLLPKIESALDYYVIIIGEGQLKEKALSIVAKLRKKYSVEYDLMGRHVKKQMELANRSGAKKAIFIGEKEIWTNTLTIRDMKTGKEEKINVDDLV